ncbi:Predicted flavoprotein CzcO associated with the cation diffusion facilitator CzcD [Geodermatophilus amargosae]|uniref:Predicted flavoprotein CzcO associated with the cation diffusion facilitator CzcD n=1 Tax=Geodermatophilus amargosae TaxID=1296565 RepID=A0A1I6X6E4_9ACTN|nr:FAD-dependent oxidoreductase [Geodermatophilus amargosae]SFT33819.1 Predicted flavoprotein CzcO associated with the cation diffusion facilitator CzcD [Geodermatophilus amargosae]
MIDGSVPVAVIGAGPYGLSVAAHLSELGVEHRIFGRPMSLWTDNMPRGMYLKSEGHASNLSDPAGRSTLRRYAAEHGLEYRDLGHPVPLDTFAGYGQWFQRRHVPNVEQVEVTTLTRDGDGFRLHLGDGSTLSAGRVVLATGMLAYAHVPDVLAGLPSHRVTHSSAHADLDHFTGRDVVVVGAGQSALETAALLHEAGARPQVLARADRIGWNVNPAGKSWPRRVRHPVSTIGTSWQLLFCAELPGAYRRLPEQKRVHLVQTTLGPAGGWWLRPRIEGVVPVTVASHITAARASGDRAELTVEGPDGTSVLGADHVIVGTGYRVDLGRLLFLDPRLRAGVSTVAGSPILDRDLQSSVPGLHVVGLPAAVSFGPVQRFVAGTGFAARRVSGAVARRGKRVRPVPAAVARG